MKGWSRSPLDGLPLERASLLRHLSIVVALAAAWAMRYQLALTNQVLWIFGVAGALNLATTFLASLRAWATTARCLSSIFGIGVWGALASLSGGASSPFIAGLWLEIIFSAVAFAPRGTLLVTAAAIAALWLQQALSHPAAALQWVWLQSGFVVVIGAITFLVSHRRVQGERVLSRQATDLAQRLREVERELDQTRQLGELGEGVARFAHGLKNTVHSLRGFTKLIEGSSRLTGGRGDLGGQAIAGLRLSIDQLEETAQATLRPRHAGAKMGPGMTAVEVDRTLDEVMEEVGQRHHGVHWVKIRADGMAGVALPRALLREVLLVLVENAAEASGATGEVTVKLTSERGMFNLIVRDRGPGISPDLADRIFQLGETTKAGGHGLGLFLARRLIEAKGGCLTAAPAIDGGALFSVTLPAQEN